MTCSCFDTADWIDAELEHRADELIEPKEDREDV